MASQSRVWPALITQRGPQPGQAFLLQKDVLTVGRAADNDIIIEDAQVSHHHARLFRWGEGWVLEDLGSGDATFVNGQRISGRVVLSPGSQVGLGPNVLFSLAGAVVPPAAPAPAAPKPVRSGKRVRSRAWWIVPIVLVLIVALVGLPLGLFWMAGRAADVRERPPKLAVAMIHSGDRVSMERPVLVQAISMDPEGIAGVELWVDGVLVDSVTPSDPGIEAPTEVSLSWQPDSPGEHVLMVRTESGDGVVNQKPVVVEAVEDLVSLGPEGEEIYRADLTQVYYAVGQGDTLSDVLRLYDVSEAEVAALNPGLDLSALEPGSLLAVPFEPAGEPHPKQDSKEEQALALLDAPADLTITNLTLSTLNPTPGEPIVVGVTILNAGGTPAEDFYWAWDPGTGEGWIHDETPIEFLSPGDDLIREMTYTYQEEGTYTGRAQADSRDAVDEGEREDNNVARVDVTVGGAVPGGSVDLAITNLTLSDRYPAPGERVTVGVTIMNAGSATAENFYWAWDPGTGEGLIHDETPIDYLSPGDDVIREMAYTYAAEGVFTGSAMADSRDAYDEGEHEDNNRATVDVHVGPGQFPDPAITNLTLSALNPRPGEEVIVGVTVANLGSEPAEDFSLSWLSDDTHAYVYVEPPIDYLAPGDDVVREFTYVFERAGHYRACAEADAFRVYPGPANNEACVEVTVSEAGASVGPAVGAPDDVLGEGIEDLNEWAQDLSGVSAPVAPQIISTEFREAGDLLPECRTVLEWRDRSDNESGFRVYRWDMTSDEFRLLATLEANDEFDIVQYADTTPYYEWSAGPNWYYVAAFNGGGEAASNYTTVEVTPFCAGSTGMFGLTGAEIEFVGMTVDKQYDRFYCYVSLDESPWFRVPENQDEFMPVEYGPIEDDLFGMGESGESYYYVSLFDYLGGEDSLVIYPSGADSFSVGVECWGWRDGRLHNLGTYQKDHPRETWDDEVATGWLEEAHGPDGWFAFWYATRQAVVYRFEQVPTVFDYSLPAPTDLRLDPEYCDWWHDECDLRWQWDGDARTIDGFHIVDDYDMLDDVVAPGARHLPVIPFEIFPAHRRCGGMNRIQVIPVRDVHEGQPADLDLLGEECLGTHTVRFERLQFGRYESPGVFNPCADSEDVDIIEIQGYILVSGVEKTIEFGPVGVGPIREGYPIPTLTMAGCEPLDLGQALALWNPWIPNGTVYAGLQDYDTLEINWHFTADIYKEGEPFPYATNVDLCTGEETYGPRDWIYYFQEVGQSHWGEGYPYSGREQYGCSLTWSINP